MSKYLGPFARIAALLVGMWLGSPNCVDKHGALCAAANQVIPGVIAELVGVF